MTKRSIPTSPAVWHARRGTAILAALPGVAILPLVAALLVFGPTQSVARIQTIKQAWTDGGGQGAADMLSNCMRQAGYAKEPDLIKSYLMFQTVGQCEKTALKMAKVRDQLGQEAYVEGAPSVKDIEAAIEQRKKTIQGVLDGRGA